MWQKLTKQISLTTTVFQQYFDSKESEFVEKNAVFSMDGLPSFKQIYTRHSATHILNKHNVILSTHSAFQQNACSLENRSAAILVPNLQHVSICPFKIPSPNMDYEEMVMMVACVVQLYQGSHIQSTYCTNCTTIHGRS